MKGGMGFLLSLGTGLGIGLFAGPGWGWQVLVGAALIATAQVVFRSDSFEAYIVNCEARRVSPNAGVYFVLTFVRNLFLIFAIAIVVFFLKGIVVTEGEISSCAGSLAY